MSEGSAIVRPILDALERIPSVLAFRVNSGGYRGRMRGAPAGTADIIACLPDGLFAAIEAKTPGARTSKRTAAAQATFGKRIQELGGLYIVAHSVAEALQGLGLR